MKIKRWYQALSYGLIVCIAVVGFFGIEAVINVIAGYIGASAVLIASFASYAQTVQTQAIKGEDFVDEPNGDLARYGDSHALLEDEYVDDAKGALREARKQLKEDTIKIRDRLRFSGAFFSLRRLGSYLFLGALFMILQETGRYHGGFFLGALGIPIVLTVGYWWRQRGEYDQSIVS